MSRRSRAEGERAILVRLPSEEARAKVRAILATAKEADERTRLAVAAARNSAGSRGSDRMLRSREVQQRTGLSRTTIWRLEREGSFPKRVQISRNVVAWRESDVAAWIAQKSGDR